MTFYDTLKDAVRDNRGNLVNSLLSEPDFDQDTMLVKAVEDSYMNVELVQLLLKRGAGVDVASRNGKTPLKAAIHARNDTLMNDCLERGADVNFGGNGHTPLHVAVERYPQAVTKLLALGADPNIMSPYIDQGNVLHNAVRFSQFPLTVLEALLAHITDMDAHDRAGLAALHIASFNDREGHAKLLLQHGANVNVVSKDGDTPLYLAAQHDHIDMVLLLLNAGADPNIKNAAGQTAASTAEKHSHHGMQRLLKKRMAAMAAE